MNGPVHFKVGGLSEVDDGLQSLMDDFDVSRTATKNVMKRGAIEALQPMADLAESLAPKLTGQLGQSVVVGTKLTTRQARLARKETDDKGTVTVYMGPNSAAAVPQEFGTFDQAAQPFMRPAFAQEAQATIGRVGGALKAQLDKATERAQRKMLRAKL